MATDIQLQTGLAGETAAPRGLTQERGESSVPRRLRKFLSLADFERAARRHLPLSVAGFVSGGSETDASVRGNLAAFQDYAFVPRVLTNVANRSLTTTLFGRQYALPLGIPPMGAAAVIAYQGDYVLARAAAKANIPFVLSGASVAKLEDIRREGATAWFQAYIPGEAPRIEALVDRVAAAGYDTFVLTADVPVSSNRENNVRNGWSLPLQPTPRLAWQGITHPTWLIGTAARTLLKHGMPYFENMDAVRGPPIVSRNLVRALGRRDHLAWEHLELVRRRFKGRLLVKGLLSKADARTARECGADGIMVSNHGGRQLDGAIAPLHVLGEIAAEVKGLTVILDGGIRRGTDVLKALALGAHFVFIGRPFLYAAAVRGEEGVLHAIKLLAEEIDRDLALLGTKSPGEVGPEMIRRVRG
jgi:L-lactate dehydrogenase (cytochrome)